MLSSKTSANPPILLAIIKLFVYIASSIDSDDISKYHRFEKQLNIFKNRDIDLVASWQEEFTEGSETIHIKTCPETNNEIKKSLKFRCLIPNPSIMFKKEIFNKVEGYGNNRLLGEDHILFAKMSIANANMYCIQESLIEVRVNIDQRKRRGGINAIKDDYKLRRELFDIGFLSIYEFIKSIIIFSLFRLLPVSLKNLVFKIIRKRKK
jgi:hypothetical protein